MKSITIIARLVFAVVLIHPAELAAQERVERLPPTTLEWHGMAADLGPERLAYITSNGSHAVIGVVAGGLTGAALGAGIGYLLYRDSTAGCDDGICGWVPPMIAGGAIGMLLGGWIGYRISVGPDR